MSLIFAMPYLLRLLVGFCVFALVWVVLGLVPALIVAFLYGLVVEAGAAYRRQLSLRHAQGSGRSLHRRRRALSSSGVTRDRNSAAAVSTSGNTLKGSDHAQAPDH